MQVEVAICEVTQPTTLGVRAEEWRPGGNDVVERVAAQCLLRIVQEVGVGVHVVGASLIEGMMYDDLASQ